MVPRTGLFGIVARKSSLFSGDTPTFIYNYRLLCLTFATFFPIHQIFPTSALGGPHIYKKNNTTFPGVACALVHFLDHRPTSVQRVVLNNCSRLELLAWLNKVGKTANQAELDAAAQVALASDKGVSKTPSVVLEMDLRHGDYMVMHRASMQLYYEVCVSGNSFVD